jgi:NADH-quinone oxidoreductase subunit J
MVLFLYVIMMLNLNKESEPHKSNLAKTAAVISGGLMLMVLVSVFKSANDLTINPDFNSQIGMVEVLGMVLYQEYLLPFEVSALLFLTAMIGATMLGKKEGEVKA